MPRGQNFSRDMEETIRRSMKQAGTTMEMATGAGVSDNAIRHRLLKPAIPASSNGSHTIVKRGPTLLPKQYARIAKAILKNKPPEVIANKVGCAVSTVQRCVAFTRGTGTAAADFIEAWGKLTRNGTRPK